MNTEIQGGTAPKGDAADGTDSESVDMDAAEHAKLKADLEPVFYSSAGTVEQSENAGTKISASI